jgi:hypothetical protein
VVEPNTQPALVRVLISWLAVGVSQMSPLQFVQFLAAIFAIVYTGIQIYKSVREIRGRK